MRYDPSVLQRDYTPTGMKLEGPYENDRNAVYGSLYRDIIRVAYGVQDVICAHHLTFVRVEKRDGFDYQVVQEIPSADALIFDHDVAKKLWGPDRYITVLMTLAAAPIEARDQILAKFFYTQYPHG